MKEKVVFILLEGFADWEGAPLAAELRAAEVEHPSFEVLYASDKKEPRRSIGGLTVLPDIALEEIPEDAQALILIGGTSWKEPAAKAVAPVAKRFLDEGKVVGAICDAARFLGAHGLLNAHQHTANFKESLEKEEESQNPAGFQEEECVRDRNLVTANGQAPYLFAREMLRALWVAETEAERWYDFNTMGLRAAIRKYYP